MPLKAQDLFARLDQLGIETTTVKHAAVFTVEESNRLLGHLPGAHCKSLFLKDKEDALWLVVSKDSRALDLKALAGGIGAGRLSFGKPELLFEVLGVTPGAVSPFALINDVQGRVAIVFDKAVMAAPIVNFHPLSNEATTAIRPADLRRFLAATGHRPIELDFGPFERKDA